VRAAAVPDTLSDAVISRTRRLTSPARAVASAAAVIGRSFDFDLLTAVTEVGPDTVAAALRELQEAYFVLPPAAAPARKSGAHRGGRRLPQRLHLGALRAGAMRQHRRSTGIPDGP
jgi:hypothetical protein